MTGITPTGIGGSSLDVERLVDDLVTAEGAPTQNRLDNQEVEIQTNISALGAFRGALADIQGSLASLRNAQDLRKVSATSSDEEKVAIIADKTAQEGNFEVEVLQLAQSHRLTSQSFKSELDPIGSGNLSFQFGRYDEQSGRFIANEKAAVRNIRIDDENNSLRGIVGAINQAEFGVRASMINDGTGFRLALSAAQTGDINAMRIVVSDSDSTDSDNFGLSRLAYDPTKGNAMNLIETARPQNAEVLLDGIQISSATNDIANAIPGITLSLKDTTEGSPVRLKTQFDIQGVKEAILGFVDVYNNLIDTVQTVSGFDPETQQAGPLSGDSAVRGIADQIRRVIGTSFNGINEDFGSLARIGIETQRNGKLTVNESKLQSSIEEDMEQVSKLFARTGSASDPLIRYVSADNDASMGVHDISISALGSKGRYIGAETGSFNNFSIAANENELILKVDGVSSGPVRITPGNYENGREMAQELQRQINSDNVFKREGASVSVQFVVDQFVITSNRIGSASRVDVISAGESLQELGLTVAAGLAGQDVQGRIGNRPAQGNGMQLTGDGDARGIVVEVLGGKTGARGSVAFSEGVAEQLYRLLENFLAPDGILQTRSEGYNSRIDNINRQREQLGRRLAVSEQRLMKQFSNLDAMLGRMRNTSQFLSNQLAGLPGAKGPDDKG